MKARPDNRTEREKELLAIARAKGDEATARQLCEDLAFLEERLAELRRLPHLRIDPKNPERQKATPAAKLYKECSQSYMNGIRILTGILKKADVSAEDNLMRQLEEFMV